MSMLEKKLERPLKERELKMYNLFKKRKETRKRRVSRVRRKFAGRLRLSVYRSNRGIFAQIIDDEKQTTVAAFGSCGLKGKKKKEAARIVGEEIAKVALEKGVDQVLFDRGRFKYHGRIKELADAARGAGLKF